MSFVNSYIRTSAQPIHFITSKDEDGDDCYFFLMSSAEKIRNLKSIESGNLNLADHGIIIASGFGHVPSKEIQQELIEKYNHSFPEEI